MKVKRQFKGYKFKVQKDGNIFRTIPLNFKTQAIIIESSASKAVDAMINYLKRVIHYNN